MLDDLAELRTFMRIAARGSLSAAARELGIGVAVVSKRLAALERRAGARLFNRTTRSLSLTDEGAALLAHVERALDEIGAAESRLARGREEPHGILRVSAPVSLGRRHLAPVAAELAAAHPRLSVDLQLDDRLVNLVDARVDVAVRIGEPQDSAAIMRKLADNYRVLAAAPAYLDAAGRPRDPQELSQHTLLRYGDGVEPWRLEGPAGASVSIDAPCRLRANSGDIVHDWALAGAGVMLKSCVDVWADLAAGRLERVLPDWRTATLPVYALLPSARYVPAKSRLFLDALGARIAELSRQAAAMAA